MNVFLAEDGRLRAIWRFVVGALLAYVAYAVAVSIVIALGATRGLALDLLFRPLWMVFLLVGFSFLLVTADGALHPLSAMGLGSPWKRDAVVGLLIGAGIVVIAGACVAVGAELQLRIVLNPRTMTRVLPVIFVVITAAMAEELAFRGYPFQRLIESVGKWPAVIIISGLFGSVHLSNPDASPMGFINTALVGALFCVAYLRTWRLWLPFGIHVGWNATLGLVLGLPVSGINEFAVVVRGSTRGAMWLTGGRYGIEAGIAGTVAIIVGFLALVAFVPQVAPPRPTASKPIALGLQPLDPPIVEEGHAPTQHNDNTPGEQNAPEA